MDSERIDDHLLLERFRQGDRDALASLYRNHHQAVFRFALYMTDDADASAEVVQETFLWLIHHPAAFDPGRGSLRAFLSGIARKKLQHRTRDRRRFEPLSPALLQSVAAGGAPDESRDLRQAIAGLPEVYREAVVLCGIEEKSYEEAAAILDCAVGTVRSRLHRGKEQLARILNKEATHA
ncbi:MAG TPA: RNA polymerase sigma factor [Bryobacteraceae bacterium]|jgi:RNA polymerase sigma-70 factor (ECF subfamily)